jgi:hypothetical protein
MISTRKNELPPMTIARRAVRGARATSRRPRKDGNCPLVHA